MNQNEEEKPLISVIVPVFNGQDYLEKCIESIEKQTYKKSGNYYHQRRLHGRYRRRVRKASGDL